MDLNLYLHEKQGIALQTKATEVLYGGARGGGKSHLLRIAAILWCCKIPKLQVYLFRRFFPDLQRNHMEGPSSFPELLLPFVADGKCEIVGEQIRFWNGARIHLCHCADEQDRYKYAGAEIHVLLIDEATYFTENIYRFLRSSVRAVGLNLSDEDKGKFPRIMLSANPGNIGHEWVKRMFIANHEPLDVWKAPRDEGGMYRQFIPARLEDNPSMLKDDPSYEAKLHGLGSPELVRAMREGDWDAIVGAFFPELSKEKHLIKPFPIPNHWNRFMSMDWGACGDGDPFSIGWWAVSDGCIPKYPRKALIRYREFYGEGLPKVVVSWVAEEIKKREINDKNIVYRVAGGDIGQKRGTGPSIFEIFREHGLYFNNADMRRQPGWQMVREKLVGLNGTPLLYAFDSCSQFYRGLAGLQYDESDPNDCMGANDHLADEVRYAVMSRSWANKMISDPEARDLSKSVTPKILLEKLIRQGSKAKHNFRR